MSSYRDDVNEIAVATDATWLGVTSVAESTGRGRDALFFRLRLLTAEQARGADRLTGRVRVHVEESAKVGEQWASSVRAANVVIEKARGRDALISRFISVVDEAAVAGDEFIAATRAVVVERGRGADAIQGQRRVHQVLSESAKGRDALVMRQRSLVDEAASAIDAVLGKARARDLLRESAQVLDEVIERAKARALLLTERAWGGDEAFGKLLARHLVSDAAAVGWDELLHLGALQGQAWTAEAGSWAMSRYAPFGFTGLAVIDGRVYATAPDGVYALDGEGEQIRAELRTGLMDMTGQVLALPVESHIEYELSNGGKAWVDVTQTQSGKPQTYSYPLKGRPQADVLTNARFEFGRGLRGRHFSYALRLEGERAHINDWSVLAMPSKRSL